MVLGAAVNCARGATCYGGSSLPLWVAVATPIVAAIGVVVALLQLPRLLRSVGISQEANTISTVSHCAQRYHDIMREINDAQYGVKRGDFKPGSWWYRYCDLQTEQFTFFQKGLLDPYVYELWMGELATSYPKAPKTGVETLATAHKRYLDETLRKDDALHRFFSKLQAIAHEEDVQARNDQVHELIRSTHARRSALGRLKKERPGYQKRESNPTSTNRAPPVTYQMVASADAIARQVTDLADQINADYSERELVVIGILTGAFMFVSDLIRHITVPVEVEFIRASSYGPGTTPGPVEIGDSNRTDLRDRHVLVVDDILDTGNTLKAVLKAIERQSPASVASCVLIAKRTTAVRDVAPEYVALNETPDVFVAGYGIDSSYRFRNLPNLYITEDGKLIPDRV